MPQSLANPLPECRYWPFYCEENIWHLCGSPAFAARETLVALISNGQQQVLLWKQRKAAESEPLIWDYHVILMVRTSGWQVWDLDSRLNPPCPLPSYLAQTFRPGLLISPFLRPRFRVLSGPEYVSTLASDRRHMRLPDGSWASPTPPWPMIGQGSNLAALLDMDLPKPGQVYSLQSLHSSFVR